MQPRDRRRGAGESTLCRSDLHAAEPGERNLHAESSRADADRGTRGILPRTLSSARVRFLGAAFRSASRPGFRRARSLAPAPRDRTRSRGPLRRRVPFLAQVVRRSVHGGRRPVPPERDRLPRREPPAPDADVDLAIVGGGLSGLALAWFLRDHRPVLFELHPRFGGVSKGEAWCGTRFSQGGAYFITPDRAAPRALLPRARPRPRRARQPARGRSGRARRRAARRLLDGPGSAGFDGRAFARYAG